MKKNAVIQSIKFAKILGETKDFDSKEAVRILLQRYFSSKKLNEVVASVDPDQYKFVPVMVQVLKEKLATDNKGNRTVSQSMPALKQIRRPGGVIVSPQVRGLKQKMIKANSSVVQQETYEIKEDQME